MTERSPPRAVPALRSLGMALGIAAAMGGLALWGGGFGARVGGGDLYGYFVPKYRYAAARALAGHLALWNPYEYCGLPLLGVAQGGSLYPPVVLVNMLLPPFAALQVFYLLHLAALSFFSLSYLGRSGMRPTGAAVGTALFVASIFNGQATLGKDHPDFVSTHPRQSARGRIAITRPTSVHSQPIRHGTVRNDDQPRSRDARAPSRPSPMTISAAGGTASGPSRAAVPRAAGCGSVGFASQRVCVPSSGLSRRTRAYPE